ncbi:hypothetical protein MCA0630 [Methylococcus capsulatus str. Bath]|jgi:hypothetical protein|uniref:DUF5063 domain-containing protein n=2 Tax=Methylococcus capsulatus TaxID=414 RepID=Q60B52_METCA|nr:hypothetical protein MCA0630 [Methylococcus capsulatus str. Bath]CAI8754865.1 conserved protein of unknown function [Methylococcus capsulatus]
MKGCATSSVATSTSSPAQFAKIAEKFCRLVEGFARYEPQDWLALIARELGPLETAVRELAGRAGIGDYSMLADIEQRHRMYVELKTFLDGMDDYWTEADLEAGDGVMTGSLSDNVTEIYFALKRGLAHWNKGPAEAGAAVGEWLSGFEVNWGYHLANLRSQLKHKATLH